MKLVSLLALLAALGTPQAQAASLKEIFQSIADETEAGNGNGHYVTTLKGKFNEKKEIARMRREVHKDNSGSNDCLYDVHADIDGAIQEIRDNWRADKTASRLKGLAAKGAITQIVYSVWDPSSGDSEYCSMSSMRVFGEEGSVLEFDFNETD